MNIKAWLKEQMVSSEAYDPDVLLHDFLEEMKNGLDSTSSSLAMIPAYLQVDGQISPDRRVAVIDAGGTNLRTGLAWFDESGNLELSSFHTQPMPGRDKEVSADEFYSVLVSALLPIKEEFKTIGFCFSYTAEILPNLDGRLLHWSKEIKIPELVGQCIGSGLIQALEAAGITDKKVAILNDTVATLVAGRAQGKAFNASSYVGFILGTGTNTAYLECNARIGKVDLGVKSQIVNVESGGFSEFSRGLTDGQLDRSSDHPGRRPFEKMISGVYMGPLALALLQALIPEDVFSDSGAAALSIMNELSTIHIDNLTADNGRDIGILGEACFSDADREIMKMVFDGVVDRAALLTAVNILAAVVKSEEGKGADRPVCITIDGSTYYKTFRMEERVQGWLSTLCDKKGLHVHCIKVDDAPVAGAAIAGLTAFSD